MVPQPPVERRESPAAASAGLSSTGSTREAPPLRIAAHNGAPIWGGAEIATTRLLHGLSRRGHDVRLYYNDPAVGRGARELGVEARRLHLGGDVALHHAARFALELGRWRPDVLLLGTFRKVWLGALGARWARVPRVVARIGLETDTPRNLKYRFVFRRWIDAAVFNAPEMEEAFREKLPDFPGEAVTILTGVRPPEAQGGSALRRTLGIPADAPLAGSVGRLATQKRYDRLIRCLPSLPDVHLLLVGEGPERRALESLAREEGVMARVHLPGHRNAVGPALDAMDVFVLSSQREGMSNAMLEALAAGVPVLSTDVSGAREALAPEADGTPPGWVVGFRVTEIAEALGRALSDPARLRAMGESARRIAARRFGEGRMLDEWIGVLRGARGPGPP